MKMLITAAFILFVIVFYSSALAVPKGMKIEYTKSPMGKVTFSGTTHADKALTCDACHPKPFAQKKGSAKIQLADHQQGQKYCFSCHNGKTAFVAQDNCNKCHIKVDGKK